MAWPADNNGRPWRVLRESTSSTRAFKFLWVQSGQHDPDFPRQALQKQARKQFIVSSPLKQIYKMDAIMTVSYQSPLAGLLCNFEAGS